jgi:hypothetical protein
MAVTSAYLFKRSPLAADPFYEASYNELVKYFSLEEDWDGYGAVAPGATAIHEAMTLLSTARDENLPPPRVMVSSSGEIGLYWRSPDAYAEIGTDGSGAYYWFVAGASAPEGQDSRKIEDGIPQKLITFLRA